MAEQILKNIYRLPVPLDGSPLKELNIYLIKDDRRSLLIDTGYRNESCREALVSQLAELDLQPGNVDVLLTHMHHDHTGLCKEAAGEKGRIYISREDQFVIGSEEGWSLFWEKNNARMVAEGFPADLLADLPLRDPKQSAGPPKNIPHVCLSDGDIIEAGGYRLQCVLVPGHTPGQMCFWIEEAGIMFLGDHVLFDISPNITFWDTLPDALGEYLQSLKKIQKYDIKLALPAHRSSGDTRQRINVLLQHHEERLLETLLALRENPGISAYDLAGKLTWRVRARNWEEFPISQKWFAVGETIAHLDHLEARGQLRREMDNNTVKNFAV